MVDVRWEIKTTERSFYLMPSVLFIIFVWMSFVGLYPPPVAGATPYNPDAALASGGDTALQFVYVVLFILVFLQYNSIRRLKNLRILLPVQLSLPLAWCWMSTLWSVSTSTGIRRAAFTTLVVFIATYLCRILGAQKVIRLLFWTLAAILALSYLAVAVSPAALQEASELDPTGGGWRGLQNHKNLSGPFCTLAALVFFYHVVTGYRPLTSLVLCLAASYFLFQTGSKSSLGFLPAAWLFGCLILFLRSSPLGRGAFQLFSALAFAIGTVLFGETVGGAFQWLSRNGDAFTGRGLIWHIVAQFIEDNYWTGSGYGGLWAAGNTSPILNYTSGWTANIPNAHNGYLDLWAQLGIGGLAVSVVMLLVSPIYRLMQGRGGLGSQCLLLASIIGFAAMHNLLETTFLQRDTGLWVALVIAINLAINPDQNGQSGSAQGRG